MDDPYPIDENAVENLVRIPDQRKHTHSGPLSDLRRSVGMSSNVGNDILNALFELSRNQLSEGRAAVGGSFSKIGDGAVGVFNLHVRRNEAKAASISCSFAIPLASASSRL